MKRILLFYSLLVAAVSSAQVTIGSGTAVDSNAGLSTPISIFYSTSLAQFIYFPSEIGSPGTITSVEFKLNQTGTLTNSNGMLDVWIGHTNVSAYNPVVSTTGADWIDISTHTQVMANGSFTVSGTTLTCTFSTPFEYNGTDNLVITVDANQPGNNGNVTKFLQTAPTTDFTSLMIRTDVAADNADPFNPPLNFTGTNTATSVQAKKTRPQIVLNGTFLSTGDFNVNTIALYPNPSINDIVVQSASKVISAQIYSITGRLVKSTDVDNDSISTEGLAPGIYIATLKLENGSIANKKFTKK
ncbi:T9SS type A sorting domain-containing protein [Flavobacterium sp. J372]|uniref:T9SS type A sorting domain-containing protein n=1 Tax=Flavobacterium sp. J372 TaxID=2898436 RepID=UPI002151CD32|nr:T9SS type A sorting domain-containing protein [Flavobacterium sp. J372]MCR5860816.1 T9SS type A sorting domain-containing protein [Flavobacterium sp. J372]